MAINLQELSDQNITEILLYYSPQFTDIKNCTILKFSINLPINSNKNMT